MENSEKTSQQMGVQNVAGSGILTDFVRVYIGMDYLDMPDSKNIKFRNEQCAYRIFVVEKENICIVGYSMQSKLIGHEFENSWDNDQVGWHMFRKTKAV